MASGRSEKELQGVTMLGHKTDYPTDYAPQVLEAFDNKHPDNDYIDLQRLIPPIVNAISFINIPLSTCMPQPIKQIPIIILDIRAK